MFLFKNYDITSQEFKSLNERFNFLVESLKTELLSEKNLEEFSVVSSKLAEQVKLQKRVNLIVSFLELNYKKTSAVQYMPSIDLGRGQGHTLGIAKFLLRHPELKVIIVTDHVDIFINQRQFIPNVHFTSADSAQSVRGKAFDLIIIDGFVRNLTEVLKHVPCHQPVPILKVGS